MNGSESFGSGERFYYSLCPVSLSKETSVICPQCKMVRYSSSSALASHREVHAPLCRLLTRLIQAAGGRNPLDRNPGAAIQLANIAKMILRRDLNQFETDLLMFPRVCGHCSAQLSDGGLECAGCEVTVHCSEQCQVDHSQHQEHCGDIRNNIEDYLYSRTTPSKHNLGSIRRLDRLPTSMKEALSLLYPEVSLHTPEGRTLSSLLSSPLTCLSALSSSWTPSSHLTVHLVGSRKIETSCLQAWSLLFSLSPDLVKITIVFIGLEVITPDPSFSPPDNMELVFVPPCTYEEHALSDHFTQPNIVCAFNCGFILYSSWISSLPHMVREGGEVPLVFTEYYRQDCQANLALLQETTPVTVLQDVRKNVFRSYQSSRSPLVMWSGLGDKVGRAPTVSDNMYSVVVVRETL